MHDLPYENTTPPSHFQHMVELDQRSSVTKIKQEAFGYMDQLTGWCSKAKASVLIDIILKRKPEVVVEIGVWGGKSLIPMACAIRANGKGRINGIDPWKNEASIQGTKNELNRQWWGSIDHQKVLDELMAKMVQFGLVDNIQLIRATSLEATPIFKIDLLHIDGNHSDETSYGDVVKWVPLMKRGGWIIFDDIGWGDEGACETARAVAYLNKHCIKLAEFSDNCIWGIWKVP